MTARAFVDITAFTHQGLVRRTNEDSIVVGDWIESVPMAAPRQWRCDLAAPRLLAIADGMGGHAAGEVASAFAARRLCAEAPQAGDADALGALLQTIDGELHAQMAARPQWLGMGTTAVGLLLLARRYLWFNVGDSRLYRYGDGRLAQISHDDVPDPRPGSMKRSGLLTQCLGGGASAAPLNPHLGGGELPVPSRWLLCSDGLSDMVEHARMEEGLARPDRAAVAALVRLAMDAGGADNISVIVASVSAEGGAG
jgi:serine/threonine protein phosphatase PrpC